MRTVGRLRLLVTASLRRKTVGTLLTAVDYWTTHKSDLRSVGHWRNVGPYLKSAAQTRTRCSQTRNLQSRDMDTSVKLHQLPFHKAHRISPGAAPLWVGRYFCIGRKTSDFMHVLFTGLWAENRKVEVDIIQLKGPLRSRTWAFDLPRRLKVRKECRRDAPQPRNPSLGNLLLYEQAGGGTTSLLWLQRSVSALLLPRGCSPFAASSHLHCRRRQTPPGVLQSLLSSS